MKVWVDADSCPRAVKDIVLAAADRRCVCTVFVAAKHLSLPESPNISLIRVDPAPDAADRYIKDHVEKDDLVVTHDIPFAYELVPEGVVVIDPRGEKYTEDNIGERLSMRNFLEGLRDSGELIAGPCQYGQKDKHAFAATFDRELTRMINKQADRQADKGRDGH